jgi:hypothetical protein
MFNILATGGKRLILRGEEVIDPPCLPPPDVLASFTELQYHCAWDVACIPTGGTPRVFSNVVRDVTTEINIASYGGASWDRFRWVIEGGPRAIPAPWSLFLELIGVGDNSNTVNGYDMLLSLYRGTSVNFRYVAAAAVPGALSRFVILAGLLSSTGLEDLWGTCNLTVPAGYNAPNSSDSTDGLRATFTGASSGNVTMLEGENSGLNTATAYTIYIMVNIPQLTDFQWVYRFGDVFTQNSGIGLAIQAGKLIHSWGGDSALIADSWAWTSGVHVVTLRYAAGVRSILVNNVLVAQDTAVGLNVAHGGLVLGGFSGVFYDMLIYPQAHAEECLGHNHQFFRVAHKNALSTFVPVAPVMLPDTLAWYDGSDPAAFVSSAGAVSSWLDKSGNDYHATQGVTTNMPKVGLASLNGKGVVFFDGGDWLIAPSAVTPVAQTPFTAYAVWMTTGYPRALFGCGSASTARAIRVYQVAASQCAFTIFDTTGTRNANALPVPLNTPNVTTVQHDGATDGFIKLGEVRGDGTWVDTKNTALTPFYIGARDSAADKLTGYIAELIMYHAVHSPEQRAVNEAYLLSKWLEPSVTLPAGETPMDMAAWWDASDAATLTVIGGEVLEWRDKSGNSRNLLPYTSATSPTKLSEVPAVAFDGTQYMLATDVFTTGAAPYTVLSVCYMSQNRDHLLYAGSLSANRGLFFANWDGGTRRHAWYGNDMDVAINTDHVLSSYRWDGATRSTRVGGASKAEPDSGKNLSSGSINFGRSVAGDGYLHGWVAEVIVYNRALTYTELAAAEAYLTNKWSDLMPNVLTLNGNILTRFGNIVAAEPTPPVADMRAWWDGGDVSSHSGTTLLDKTGNGYDLVLAAGAAWTYDTWGSKQAVKIGPHKLSTVSNEVIPASDQIPGYTIFMLVYPSSPLRSDEQTIFVSGNGYTQNIMIRAEGSKRVRHSTWYEDNYSAADNLLAAEPLLMVAWYDPLATLKMSLDMRDLKTSIAGATTLRAAAGVTIGTTTWGPHDLEYFSGMIGEVIVYTRPLSDAEISATKSYLKQRWGMPMPAVVDDLFAWYDVSETSTLTVDGSNYVTGLKSKIGPGVANSTAGCYPLLTTDPSISDRPLLKFDGAGITSSGDYLNFVNYFGQTGGWPFTFFIVCTTGGSLVTLGGYSTQPGAQGGTGIGTTMASLWFVNSSPTLPLAAPANVLNVFVARYNHADRAYYLSYGADSQTGTMGVSLALGSALALFGKRSQSTGSTFNGHLGEILAYRRALSDAEVAAVVNELKTKWGIA